VLAQRDVRCTLQLVASIGRYVEIDNVVNEQRVVSNLVAIAERNLNRPGHHTTTTTVSRPFFRDHHGEPVPEENFWTLWCKGRLTEADTPTIRMGATPSGLTSAHLHHSPYFYRPDALPAAQPTASKHRRQLPHSD